ncbi:ricin-type beta-trefoil lectin domain protein [Longispora sp. NPDC051575]|uniref:ricin-type beta-trefoil lectin domain protein n=1 Tax=Longispora sp. NPDC051575 TaxID=3154943 RepID=UPI0034191D04
MRKSFTRWAWAAAGLLAVSPVAVAGPGAPAHATPGAAPSIVLSAMQRDLGLTAAQAEARIVDEERAGQTDKRLRTSLGGAYAGTWLSADATVTHVAVTTQEAADLVRDAGAEPTVVTYSAADLRGVQETLDKELGSAGLPVVVTFVDVAANRVAVRARPKLVADIRAVALASGIPAGAVSVVGTTDSPTPTADIVGGSRYDLPGYFCSSGFAVDNGGFVTAGHCGVQGANTSSPSGTFQGSRFPGDDYAWVATPGRTPQPWVSDHAGGYMTVRGSAEAPVGASVCRSGAASGLRCGVITAWNTTVTYTTGETVYGMISANVCSAKGDSGGALISGFQAQGVNSGGNGDCNSGGYSFYQPVNEILAAYGLTLTVENYVPPVVTDHAPRGILEAVTAQNGGLRVEGWAADEDLAPRTTPTHVDLSVDGAARPRLLANQNRPDVGVLLGSSYGPNHGFSTYYSLANGPHTVCAWAHNHRPNGAPNEQPATALGCRTVTVGGGPPAQTSGPISSVYSTLCLDVTGGVDATGTRVQLYTCNGTPAQNWKVASDGTLRVYGGKCLDIVDYGTANSAPFQIWDCHAGVNQVWQTRPGGVLYNANSGRCMDNIGYGTTNGSPVGLWDCNGASNQQWRLPS